MKVRQIRGALGRLVEELPPTTSQGKKVSGQTPLAVQERLSNTFIIFLLFVQKLCRCTVAAASASSPKMTATINLLNLHGSNVDVNVLAKDRYLASAVVSTVNLSSKSVNEKTQF